MNVSIFRPILKMVGIDSFRLNMVVNLQWICILCKFMFSAKLLGGAPINDMQATIDFLENCLKYLLQFELLIQ